MATCRGGATTAARAAALAAAALAAAACAAAFTAALPTVLVAANHQPATSFAPSLPSIRFHILCVAGTARDEGTARVRGLLPV